MNIKGIALAALLVVLIIGAIILNFQEDSPDEGIDGQGQPPEQSQDRQ